MEKCLSPGSLLPRKHVIITSLLDEDPSEVEVRVLTGEKVWLPKLPLLAENMVTYRAFRAENHEIMGLGLFLFNTNVAL